MFDFLFHFLLLNGLFFYRVYNLNKSRTRQSKSKRKRWNVARETVITENKGAIISKHSRKILFNCRSNFDNSSSL